MKLSPMSDVETRHRHAFPDDCVREKKRKKGVLVPFLIIRAGYCFLLAQVG
jgi:hypothetical protein